MRGILDVLAIAGASPRVELDTHRVYVCPRCAAVGINGCEHGFEVLCFPCSEWDGHGVRVDGEANT